MYYDIEKSGERINKLRKERGLTQVELAEVLDIHAKTISKVERGICGMSVDYLLLVAEYFNVTLDYLVIGKEDRSSRINEYLTLIPGEKKIAVENILKEILNLCLKIY